MFLSQIANLSKSLIYTLLLISIPILLVAEGSGGSTVGSTSSPQGSPQGSASSQQGSPQALPSCFVPDTKILMGDGLEKAIKDIQVGDQVINPVSGKIAKVVNVLESFESEPIVVITVGNKTVKVTETHPVKTDEGTIPARDVKRGHLANLNGTKAEVSKVQYLPVKAKQKVFNIRLEGDDQLENHMLLSNGIVTGDLTAMEIINQPVAVQVEPVITLDPEVIEEEIATE